MNSKFRISFALLLLSFYSVFGQYISPKASLVYSDARLPRIDITINQTDIDFILADENKDSDEPFPSSFKYTSSDFNFEASNVAFRLRGNTSRSAAKKSFKISFNEYLKGGDIDGFEKLNLNGEHNDPSMIRSKLCWDILNDMNVPSSRANHVKLYINNEYKGLYINVEHVDEEFIEKRFDNKSGKLYKCLYPADLAYKGSDPNLYKEEFWGRRAYELKMNEETDDYSGLANFIQVLNKTPNAQFITEIEKVFDVSSYLKTLAVEAIAGHWDNYSINQNNYYLYENPTDSRFYYIPYDFDNTLGIDWINTDWTTKNIYQYYDTKSNRPLTKKLLEQTKYREEYTRIIDGLLKNQFNPSNMNPRIDAIKASIQTAAEDDTYRTLDYGFTISDFNKSFNSAVQASHVKYSLKEYIEKRRNSALNQLDEIILLDNNMQINATISPNPVSEQIHITSTFIGKQIAYVYSIDGKLLQEYSFESNETTFTHQLSKGTYILRIKDSNSMKYSMPQRILVASVH
jgi:spore coat protein CotH